MKIQNQSGHILDIYGKKLHIYNKSLYQSILFI